MISSTFILAAVAAATDENIATKVGLSWPHLLSQTVVFVLVALALKRFAFAPILEVLDQRRTKIEESLKNADQIKAELAEAEASRKKILTQANEQATALIAEAQKSAAIQGERRLQEAIAQAEDIISKAHATASLDRDRMMTDLKREVGRLVIDTTSKVTGKILTSADQQKLNDETSRQLASSN